MKNLSAKKVNFVCALVELRNPIYAYERVFNTKGMSENTIAIRARQLMEEPDVKEAIAEQRRLRDCGLLFDANDVFYEWISIYTADVNEIVSVCVGPCRHCHGIGHKYQWTQDEYLRAEKAVLDYNEGRDEKNMRPMPDISGGIGFDKTRPPHPTCTECNGLGEPYMKLNDTTRLSPGARRLYRGAKLTKNGIEVLMADKDKALDNIAKVLGMFQERILLDTRQDGEMKDVKDMTEKEAHDYYLSLLNNRDASRTTH